MALINVKLDFSEFCLSCDTGKLKLTKLDMQPNEIVASYTCPKCEAEKQVAYLRIGNRQTLAPRTMGA
jgi:hypothetical protein